MTLQMFTWRTRYLKVLGKGNKERVVAFGANCRRTLIHYAYHYRFEADSSSADAFFLSIDGYTMQKEALKSIMRRLADTSGVPRLHALLPRHTYATHFVIHGGDPFLLKHNLGHTTWAMVEQYVHLADQHRALMGKGSSPLDNLRATQDPVNLFARKDILDLDLPGELGRFHMLEAVLFCVASPRSSIKQDMPSAYSQR